MKNFNDTIRNRNRDLLAWSPVPQPTALPHVPVLIQYVCYIRVLFYPFLFIILGLNMREAFLPLVLCQLRKAYKGPW
jgi:hypothetical protein